MPYVSIIIPVYNVEKYILECLESVIGQTYNDYEVIIVNDGSDDISDLLISNFIVENKADKFRLITKENGGVSSARNVGLDVAKGEWVTFIDGDDWVEPDYLKVLVDCLRQYPSDLCIGGYQAFDEDSSEFEKWNDYPKLFGTMPQDLDGLHSFGFIWGRLYKKSIIDKGNIRFDERIEYSEDKAWQFDYNKLISSYCCTNKVLYNYRINREGSLTEKLISPQMKFYVAEHVKAYCEVFEKEEIENALKINQKLSSSLWGALTTYVVNCILNKEYKTAKQEKNKPLSKTIINYYKPRTKKEKLFNVFWKMPFSLLVLPVKIYYGNFETMRKSSLVKFLSKRK